MDSFTPLTHPVLYVAAIGFLSGAFISLQDAFLSWIVNKQWLGWGVTISQSLFSTLGLATIFGLGALLLTAGGPDSPIYMPATETIGFFTKIGILMAIITPLSGQISKFLSDRSASGENE